MSPATFALDRVLDPVGQCLTPDVARRLLDLEVDPQIQERVDLPGPEMQ